MNHEGAGLVLLQVEMWSVTGR